MAARYHPGDHFENLVDDLFCELELSFERHPRFPGGPDRKFVEPDFVFAGNEWWDAKLNAHAPHVDECINAIRHLPVSDHHLPSGSRALPYEG